MQLWLDCPSPPPARPFINCIVTAKFLACCWYWNALDWTQVCHLWSELLSLFLYVFVREHFLLLSLEVLRKGKHFQHFISFFFFSKYIRINRDVSFCESHILYCECLFVSCIWFFSVLMLEWTHNNKEAQILLSAFVNLNEWCWPSNTCFYFPHAVHLAFVITSSKPKRP